MWRILSLFLVTIIGLGFLTEDKTRYIWPRQLSDWKIFEGKMADLIPSKNAIHYDVRSPLYSDYAYKQRLIILPDGQSMKYTEEGSFDFPPGTVLAKTFYYPNDFRDEDGIRDILETRIMVLENDIWHAASYAWDQDQTDAKLAFGGYSRNISWKGMNGKSQSVKYIIPNANQCTNCHTHQIDIVPLGITARQMNHGGQLELWSNNNWISRMPDIKQVPDMPNYADVKSGTLNERARAYLDVNCGHCHSENGPANSSGLNLNYTEADNHMIGVMKSPIAAGRGSGGKKFSIVPGKPKASILLYRMESDDPGVRMPEINRQIPHAEGISLIREWIKEMD